MVAQNAAGIHIAAIGGSVRSGNYTSKALAFVADEMRKHAGVTQELIDPSRLRLDQPGIDGGTSDAASLED